MKVLFFFFSASPLSKYLSELSDHEKAVQLEEHDIAVIARTFSKEVSLSINDTFY